MTGAGTSATTILLAGSGQPTACGDVVADLSVALQDDTLDADALAAATASLPVVPA